MHRPAVTSFVCLLAVLGAACSHEKDDRKVFSAPAVNLKRLHPAPEARKLRRTVYVPIYSSIYRGVEGETVELAATLSIRNVSFSQPIILDGVDYYTSTGKKVREYLAGASELAPMASAEYVIDQRDREGGPGASFIVRWSSVEDVDEPVIEAVMVGQSGTAGISFTSLGRTLQGSAQAAPSGGGNANPSKGH